MPAAIDPPACSLRRGLAGLLAVTVLGIRVEAQDSGYQSIPVPDVPRVTIERVPIFFPPSPPPLGRALPRTPPPAGRLTAPVELAAYVNELFYPPLGTRLVTQSLTPKLRTQLEQYRAAKLARQKELRAELERVNSLEPADREAALTAFARTQAEAVAALEAAAEQLRRNLIASDQNWSAYRQWHLGDREKRAFSPFEIAQVMRAYAYYQDGLVPAQRRLLREISLELQAAGDSADTAAANQPYLFFPPEPARVLLPDDIPADVAAKLALYQTRKSALKKELYDAVYEHDGQTLRFLRGNSLKALAERQAERLVELENQAEDIRRGLNVGAEPVAIVERSPLPPVLQQRVATLLSDVGAAQKVATAKIEGILAAARDLPLQANYRFEADGLKFLVIPSRVRRSAEAPVPDAPARIAAVRESIAAVANDYGRQLAGFINERDAIRAEAAQSLNLAKADRVDNALSTAMRVATARATEGEYREYRIALFQPGLSPAQRRLLFDSVVERLELPLPRGELQPLSRAATW